jgi:RNA polymerase sigma factor (sigma-70 family)
MELQAAVDERRVVDETALVEALRQGDREAFATLVDANSAWMMRIALSHVSSRASAEDAVQEAWLRCLRDLDGFEGRSALKNWLFVIVTNCARRRAERESRSLPFSELARREAERTEPEPLENRFFDDSHPRWPGGWTGRSRGLPGGRQAAMSTRPTMSCRELVALVTEYLDGTMPPAERIRFERHVAVCPPCRGHLEQMRETIRASGALTEESISPAAREALLNAFADWRGS